MLQSFQERFYLNFIADDRWKYLVNGLKVTLTITFFALIIGVVLGFLVAIVRSTYDESDLQSVSDGDPRNSGCRPAFDHLLYHLRKCGHQQNARCRDGVWI